MKTHYDVLSISPDASVEVIHAVYKALNDEYAKNTSQADDIANLNAAYTILSDSTNRKRYDESLISNSESTITPEEPEVLPLSLNEPKQNKKYLVFGMLAITAVTVSLAFVLIEKYDVIGLVKTKISDAPLPNNKINEAAKQEPSVKPIDTATQSNNNLTVDAKPEKIQSEIETKPDIDARKDEFDKLLAQEKAKNDDLVKEIETQKLEQAEAKKIELEKVAAEEKLRNDTLAQELETQKLEQEKSKQIEFNNRLAEEEKERTKQAEIYRLLAAEKSRSAEVAVKKAAILKEQERIMIAIKQKVNQNWKSLIENTNFSLINPEVVAKFKCTIAVTLTSDGRVLDTTIEKNSDYAGFDQVAEKAITSSSPFLMTEDIDLFQRKFKKLTFVFDRNTATVL